MTDNELTAARIEQMRIALSAELAPEQLEINDESHLHAGHAGARSGRGHFQVTIVAHQFTGMSLVKRHRLVYGALGDLMETDIHALGIDARAPNEAGP